jgi:hypothetical protein
MMVRALHGRAVAACLLLALFAWNAPAMALPALVQKALDCEKPVTHLAEPTPLAANAHAMHHPGMHHGAMVHGGVQHGSKRAAPQALPPVAPRLSIADCFREHTCCSFNREPGRKSDAYSLSDSRVEDARVVEAAPARRVVRHSEHAVAVEYARPVFDLKADLRI